MESYRREDGFTERGDETVKNFKNNLRFFTNKYKDYLTIKEGSQRPTKRSDWSEAEGVKCPEGFALRSNTPFVENVCLNGSKDELRSPGERSSSISPPKYSEVSARSEKCLQSEGGVSAYSFPIRGSTGDGGRSTEEIDDTTGSWHGRRQVGLMGLLGQGEPQFYEVENSANRFETLRARSAFLLEDFSPTSRMQRIIKNESKTSFSVPKTEVSSFTSINSICVMECLKINRDREVSWKFESPSQTIILDEEDSSILENCYHIFFEKEKSMCSLKEIRSSNEEWKKNMGYLCFLKGYIDFLKMEVEYNFSSFQFGKKTYKIKREYIQKIPIHYIFQDTTESIVKYYASDIDFVKLSVHSLEHQVVIREILPGKIKDLFCIESVQKIVYPFRSNEYEFAKRNHLVISECVKSFKIKKLNEVINNEGGPAGGDRSVRSELPNKNKKIKVGDDRSKNSGEDVAVLEWNIKKFILHDIIAECNNQNCLTTLKDNHCENSQYKIQNTSSKILYIGKFLEVKDNHEITTKMYPMYIIRFSKK